MPSVTGGNVEKGAWGTSKSKGRDAGVSRLSVGFRHLMDWSKETRESTVTNPGSWLGGSGSNLKTWWKYNMTQGEASNLPGGGFPRAEAAIVTGLGAETPDEALYTKSAEWFDRYVRQMEYAITEQSPGHLSGSQSSPAIPSRRWIYGVPNKPTRHGGGDIHQPVWEKIIKSETDVEGEAESGGGPVGKIYTKVYMNMLMSMNKVQPKEMQNLIKFLMKQDEDSEEGLGGMGAAMLKGMLKDLGPLDETAQDLIAKDYGTKEQREGKGVSSAKSRQELLAILTDIGLVVGTGHGELGGSEPMDVLFHKPHTIKYPDPVKGGKEITIRLADITEEDWTKPGHHGTGTGKTQIKTEKDILKHYNKNDGSGQGRIDNYNDLIKLVRKYVDMASGASSAISGKKAGKGSDQSWDAWYRRRATQIATDLQENLGSAQKVGGTTKAPRTGTGAESRGRQDMLKLELNEWLATEDAWFAENNIALESVTAEDLKHVLHHMGSANAMYEFENDAGIMEKYDVNRDGYGEMISYDSDGEEFTVIINFQMYKNGLVRKLGEGDVAIVKQSLSALFMSFWSEVLTPQQQYEAWDLLTTVSGMTSFTSYFAETAGVATAAGKSSKRFTVRADAAIPQYMDDLMYMFFHGGNALMKKGMMKLMGEMEKIGKEYSSTLRPKLWGKISNRWPTYAWGAANPKYGGVNDDRTHSGPKYPPMGLARQFDAGIDFGDGKQFFPQIDTAKKAAGQQMWPFQTEEEYINEHGFSPYAGTAERIATGHQGKGPKRKRVQPKHGVTDFEQAAKDDYSSKLYLDWWRAAPVMWSPDWTSRGMTTPDPLEFVWAAPYVTWQHYQMSGSVK